MKEVLKDIIQIEIPLPGSPLKVLNSYLIKGEERHLLVDVGYNTDEGEAALMAALSELEISLGDVDIFLTHLHGDHTGLIERLKSKCGKIYISKYDGEATNNSLYEESWIKEMEPIEHMGLPENEKLHYTDHPGFRGGVQSETAFSYLAGQDVLPVGRYNFEVIDLKGHTPGQLGLYSREAKILFCGDHILAKITPNINAWDFDNDYLGLFLDNLRKVKEMEIDFLLTGHRAFVEDHRNRVDELIAHHERRLSRILEMLSEGEKTVYQVAMGVKWDFSTSFFGDFPPAQKWFAGNEVFAHLEYLRRRGKIEYTVRENTFYYALSKEKE